MIPCDLGPKGLHCTRMAKGHRGSCDFTKDKKLAKKIFEHLTGSKR